MCNLNWSTFFLLEGNKLSIDFHFSQQIVKVKVKIKDRKINHLIKPFLSPVVVIWPCCDNLILYFVADLVVIYYFVFCIWPCCDNILYLVSDLVLILYFVSDLVVIIWFRISIENIRVTGTGWRDVWSIRQLERKTQTIRFLIRIAYIW